MKISKLATLLTVLNLIFLFSSCAKEENSCDIVVLYTTDVHGNVLPYDFNRNTENEVSLANLSSLVKELTSSYGRKLLLLDGGDFYQGNPAMYYYNFYSTNETHLTSLISNYLKYDALVIGNHDLESGGERVDSITSELEMPRLGANVMDSRTKRARFRPYKVFDYDNFRIAVMGFVTPQTENQISHSLIPYMSFQTMVASASRWSREIRANEEVDYIIAIAHTGLKDVEIITPQNDTIRDGMSYIAEKVKGIDLLLFGHDHGIYSGEMINQWGDTVKLLQPAAHGAEVGRIDIHLEKDKEGNLTKTTKCERLDLRDFAIDQDYFAEFSWAIDTVNNFLNRPINYLPEDLDMDGTLFHQTNTIDLIHSVQLDATDADISFCSALSTFRELPAGDITYRTIFNLYKYDNQLHKMWMKGSDIKAFLEYGYGRQFGRMRSESSHLLAFKYDKQNTIIYGRFGPELVTPQYNYTSAAGINYEVDVRKPVGERVRIISMADGSPFDISQYYTVAISSYQAAGGGGFIPQGLGWTQDDIAYHTLTVSKKTIAKLIVEYMKAEKHLTKRNIGYWKVLPEEWAEQMGRRDAALLMPYLNK